jgi:hypothetical protein
MEDWDAEWKIPIIEREQPETQHPKVEEVGDEEEEEGWGNQENGPGGTQNTIPQPWEKRKDTDKGKPIL